MPRFEVSTRVPASPERVFKVSLSVDVHTSAFAGSGERAVAGVTSGLLTLGDHVTWEARHFGLRWRLTSTISACEAPTFFVDEQVAGPLPDRGEESGQEPDFRSLDDKAYRLRHQNFPIMARRATR
ncbi:SRPBCC family protein [Nonomuraea cavernae]|uniref:SRPBCC family protein n=1 Tax=Nonomuraea cavernae TaxID=2045107 RepID=UPI0033CFBB46